MGFGILFRLDESSLGSHLNERRVRGEDEGAPEIETESHKEISESDSVEEVINEVEGEEGEAPSKLETDHHEVMTMEDAEGHSNGIKNIDMDERGKYSTSSPRLDDIIDRALEVGPSRLLHKDLGFTDNLSILPEDHEGIKSTGRDKPYISKTERRRLKKNQRSGRANDSLEQEEDDQCSSSCTPTDKNHQNLNPANAKIVRGQRSKLKKIKEKYAEQDEEEREIRMALLAVSSFLAVIPAFDALIVF